MRIFKKEKKVVGLIRDHLEAVERCLDAVADMLRHYMQGDLTGADERADQVDVAESKADEIRREIGNVLFEGAYLPLIREDVYRLVESVDRIANGAETCADFFLGQRPQIPEELRAQFLDIATESFATFVPLKRAISIYFKPKRKLEDFREFSAKVGRIETAVDTKEWQITRQIFGSNLELGHKLHLKLALDHIVEIPDRAEDCADRLELTGLKSVL